MNTSYMKKTWMNLGLAVILLGAATVARAENFSVEVPFAFAAGGKSFPAGAYNVDAVASGMLIIRGTNSGLAAAILASPASYSESIKTSLIFERSPDIATLSSVNLNSGLTLTVIPSKRLTAAMTLPPKGSVALSHP